MWKRWASGGLKLFPAKMKRHNSLVHFAYMFEFGVSDSQSLVSIKLISIIIDPVQLSALLYCYNANWI